MKNTILLLTLSMFMAILFFNDSVSGQTVDKKYPFLVEIIVVFKKEVSPATAKEIMEKIGNPYREGMDSSRGKIYFYKTGSKFIMHVSKDEKTALMKKLSKFPEIYEVYEPNWDIRKD